MSSIAGPPGLGRAVSRRRRWLRRCPRPAWGWSSSESRSPCCRSGPGVAGAVVCPGWGSVPTGLFWQSHDAGQPRRQAARVGGDELGHVLGVLADDDVLRHVGAGEAAVLDRVEDAGDRPLAADVEVRATVGLGCADVRCRAMRPGGVQGVTARAALREELGARVDGALRLRNSNLLGAACRSHAWQYADRRQRQDLRQPAHRAEIIMTCRVGQALTPDVAAGGARGGGRRRLRPRCPRRGGRDAPDRRSTSIGSRRRTCRAASGPLTIVVHNDGRLTHDLVITQDGRQTASTEPLAPGQTTDLVATLTPGRYLMASTILSDQALGAYGTLDVGLGDAAGRRHRVTDVASRSRAGRAEKSGIPGAGFATFATQQHMRERPPTAATRGAGAGALYLDSGPRRSRRTLYTSRDGPRSRAVPRGLRPLRHRGGGDHQRRARELRRE